MREAAVHEEWDRLVSIEQQCSELVDAMKPLDTEAKLDEAERQNKNQLISKILADDVEIRNLTQAWMGQLQLSMKSNRQELQLLRPMGFSHNKQSGNPCTSFFTRTPTLSRPTPGYFSVDSQ